MDEIRRLQKLAGIDEIKVNNPTELYTIKDWVLPYHKLLESGLTDWDELRSTLGEDEADAIQMSNYLSNPFTKSNAIHHLEKEWENSWDGTVESFIDWLKEYDIIEN